MDIKLQQTFKDESSHNTELSEQPSVQQIPFEVAPEPQHKVKHTKRT